MQPGVYYPGGGVPAITLGGTDVTGALHGGQLGADITLRDSTLPTDQAELDEFAQNLASGFAAQGLPLFTDGSGTVPAGGGKPVQAGYVGFAAEIQVNPAVQANPAAVRDGIPSQNSSGLAGFNTVITQVLNGTFGPLSGTHTAGLGPTGTLNAPYVAPTTLGGLATALVGAQSAANADTASQLTTEQAVQTTLQGKLSSETGVNLDSEMSNMIALQNAYGANARVMNVVQSMFTELLSAVGG
jgi:flagellar hook-associated protein 1